ncbi:MAG: zinc metallopeptidase [Pseudomonadota bacterium]
MLYILATLLVLAAVFGPSIWVRAVVRRYSVERPDLPGTGGELAVHLVQRMGLEGVGVERTDPNMDHYSPDERVVRLSPEVYDGKSLSAVAIATHEVGHAVQHFRGDTHLALRTRLAPTVDQLGRLSIFAISVAPILGLLTRHPVPMSITIGIGLVGMLARTLLHLVTLPTEIDASFGKAMPILKGGEYIDDADLPAVRRVLQAAAMTYLASALADVLNLWRWIAILLRR